MSRSGAPMSRSGIHHGRLSAGLFWAALGMTAFPPDAHAAAVGGFTLGGSSFETVYGVATDAAKNIYLAGETQSTDFLGQKALTTARTNGDAFVVKLSSTGQLIYTVIISGGLYD